MIRRLDALLKILAAALVVVLLGTVTAGVVFRAINHPLSWTDEISGFLMVWLACLGWMIATRHGSHIRIRLLQDRLPAGAWRATEVLIQLVVATIGAVVAYKSIHLVQVNADIEAVSLPVSTAWMYVPLIPAGALTVVQALADLWTARRPDASANVLTP
jgi:TRAP-type C4-dicarboxylate transport system permease small subunit